MAASLSRLTNGNPNKHILIMMLSENYDFNLLMVKWVIIFGNEGISHRLWVTFFLQCFSSVECRVIGVHQCEEIRASPCREFGVFQSEQTRGSVAEIMGGKWK